MQTLDEIAPILCFFTLHVSSFFLKSGVKFFSRAFDAEIEEPVGVDFGGQLRELDSSLPIRLNAIKIFNNFQ